MRRNRNDYQDNNDRYMDDEPHRLHESRTGHSDRGRYTLDSHFNLGYGAAADNNYGDQRSYNMNADQGHMYPQGRFQSGGATYRGEDYSRSANTNRDNPYGMTFTQNDGHNSGRHYDSRADYSNTDYDDMRRNSSRPQYSGMPDERFGHDVSRGGSNDAYMGHSSIGDYESYRRYEQNNRMYDNDYRGGFAGRNFTQGRDHFGEDSYNSNLDRWNRENDQRSGGQHNERNRR